MIVKVVLAQDTSTQCERSNTDTLKSHDLRVYLLNRSNIVFDANTTTYIGPNNYR